MTNRGGSGVDKVWGHCLGTVFLWEAQHLRSGKTSGLSVGSAVVGAVNIGLITTVTFKPGETRVSESSQQDECT